MRIINHSFETVPIERLKPHPRNPRQGDLDAIESSIDANGFWGCIIAQRSTGYVLAGNHRLLAARRMGATELPVTWVDVDDDLAVRILLADNRTSDLATYDDSLLAQLLQDIRAAQGDLLGTGYNPSDLDQLLADLGKLGTPQGLTDPDEVPEPPDEAITQPGDVWVLGDHRLMCGDSANREHLERLLDGHKVQLVNTDPPYNVKVEPRSNNAIAAGLSSFSGATHHQSFDAHRNPDSTKRVSKMRPKDRPLANDFMTDAEFEKLLLAWFANIAWALDPGRSFYIWGGYANIANYPPALKAALLYFSQAIIWVKGHPVLTRKDFMGNHEWCFYGWKEGAAHWFNPQINNATDVWDVKKTPPQAMVHLTEKPVELAERALEYSSRVGERVLDLFGGSGSTLIACERMGRRAYLMELDPLYCDVIVKRWENFTGKKAERE